LRQGQLNPFLLAALVMIASRQNRFVFRHIS
jgi:hypothetical protein